jgi:hypothetical protein
MNLKTILLLVKKISKHFRVRVEKMHSDDSAINKSLL